LAVVDGLVASLVTSGIPHEKIALLGFSQGAMLVMFALAERPERYRAGVALSGRLVERPGQAPSQAVEPHPVKTPILVVAGTKDGIIPQEASWSAADELARLGREVERFSFVGAHSVPPAAIEAVRLFVAKVTVPTARTTPAGEER
ncbi:MAG TPA: dienelactone hydrolase family protein, partial [Myxococcota bacterium]|nr:dienelactone hydrolase family protein [Myxococcota bacterium]